MTRKAWTINQLVAYNLAKARRLRGWTQDEAAGVLERYTGGRWSKASWSAAERSVDGVRVRQFGADDLVAFSLCFDLPLSWWLMPPGTDDPDVEIASALAPDGTPEEALAMEQDYFVDLVFKAVTPDVEQRLEETGLAGRVKKTLAPPDELEAQEKALRRAADVLAGARKAQTKRRTK